MKWIGQHIYDNISRFRDDIYLEDLSTTTETSVLVVDSDGKVSKSTTLADDIIESEIDTLTGLTSFGAAGATTDIAAGDLTMYNAVNDGNPTISIGSSATDRLEIKSEYHSGAQTFNWAKFTSYSSSSASNAGRFGFYIDETNIFGIIDDGVRIAGSKALEIGSGNTILSDSSGTTTLSNIDALDATTIATIETAMESNLDTLGDIAMTKLTIDGGTKNITPSVDGTLLHLDTSTLTDNNTAEGGTSAAFNTMSIEGSTIAATNESTITDAATVYIKDAPTAGANKTITKTWALWVDDGDARFDSDIIANGDIDLEGDIDVNGTLETDALTIGGAAVLAAATTSAVGAVELATTAETTTGTDTHRVVTPDGLKDGYEGSSNVTTLGTIETGVWNGTKITDIYTNTSGRRYGDTIKILPSDWMINDDAASPLSFKDGSNSGVHVNDTANEMIAFVTIPEGMKATHVDVYSTNTKVVEVWELNVNATFDFTGTPNESGNANTQITVSPNINATATNFLAIIYKASATSNRVWGGIVTIAAQ